MIDDFNKQSTLSNDVLSVSAAGFLLRMYDVFVTSRY